MESAVQIGLLLLFAIPITIFDLRQYRIPDYLTFGGIFFFIVLKVVRGGSSPALIALECGLGFGVFWAIHHLTRGKMGLGDAKYSALIAVAVGLLPWFVTLFIASVAGVLFALVMILVFGMDRRTQIPFAPFLTLGAVLALLLRGFYEARITL